MAKNSDKVLGSNREWSQAAFDALSEFNTKLDELKVQHRDHEGPRSHVNQNVLEGLTTMQLNVHELLGTLGHLAPKAERAAPEEPAEEKSGDAA